MPREDQTFEFSTKCDQATTADYFEQLARHIRNGNLQLSAGNKNIGLTVKGEVRLAISAEAKPDQGIESLQLEISWQTPVPPKEEPDIRIEGGVPGD